MRILTKFKKNGAVFETFIELYCKTKDEYLFIDTYLIEQKFKNYLFFCIFAVRFLLKNNK
ncbi:hypothetical protein EGI05_02825 [Chryseobacterium daecheongense]|uniref:Uncharacterized protein n=1 Tax=Chryseobacterium daecheongense TaxID=192389 RepID=A0A3N0W6T1_9FLAO|nr:hypothetical protein EGI05_02825 [Chryseobacterium daecheongense]